MSSSCCFPTTLSPSPVALAFNEIRWDQLECLSKTDKAILQAGEENVLEYTLARQEDASHYTLLLLKILNQVISDGDGGGGGGGGSRRSSGGGTGTGGKRRLSQLPLADNNQQGLLLPTRDEALILLELDTHGVMAHYAVSKLYQVISTICTGFSKTSTTSIGAIFYPSGLLLEDWRPLHRIMMMSTGERGMDAYLQRGCAFCLVSILMEGIVLQRQHRLFQPVTTVLESFVSWTTSRLQSASSGSSTSSSSSAGKQSLAIVTPSLVVLITMKEARAIFDKAGGIGYMSRHLKIRHVHHHHADTTVAATPVISDSGAVPTGGGGSGGSSMWGGTSVQQLYELCFCLWVMSFDVNDSEERRKHFHRDGAIPALVDIVAAAPREKVVRCALAALCNLAQCSSIDDDDIITAAVAKSNKKKQAGTEAAHFLNEMIGCGLVKSIDLLQEQRKYTDPDIADDLKLLSGLLHEAFKDLTRWELYVAEVESGHLQWGVLHTEKFFKQNAKLMEGENANFEVVKKLVRLAGGEDEDVAAVACFDLGEFARHYPNGRSIAKRLLARNVVMSLIEHEHDELQRQALTCISKMLVQNWQSIG